MRPRRLTSHQPKLFQHIDMEALVPQNHILRQIDRVLDFSAIHEWVAPLYSERTGRPAVDPELVMRIILLSYLFNHSERELFQTLPMHAGYLWFLGLDFESVLHPEAGGPRLPDRTTVVKTRKLWRRHGIFEKAMRHVVDQCIAAGLVQPEVHVAVDGTLVRANASIHSLKPIAPAPVESLDAYLARLEEEDRSFSDGGDEDDSSPSDPHPPDPGPNLSSPGSPSASSGRPPKKPGDFRGERFSNRTHRSMTDPDARLYRKSSGQEAHLRYLIHHTVDTRSSVILRTQAKIITGTAEREAAIEALLHIRREHPSLRIQSVSGDGGYADTETLDRLLKMDVVPLIPVRSLQKEALPGWRRAVRDPEKARQRWSKIKAVLVRNKVRRLNGQTHYRAIRKRRVVIERLFAEGKEQHGLSRARSRGLEAMQEQAILTAVVQNLKRLSRYVRKRPQTGSFVCLKPAYERLTRGAAAFLTVLFVMTSHLVRRRWSIQWT